MSKYSTSSLIVKSSTGLYQYALTSYTYSVLRVLLNWCRHSKINQFMVKYLQRSSSLKSSATYRICSNLFSSVDRLWDRLYDFAVKTGKASSVISLIQKTFYSSNGSIAYSLFILFFCGGFGVVTILLGTFNSTKAILLALGFLTSTLLLVGKSSWSACLKGSLFRRIVLYVFD